MLDHLVQDCIKKSEIESFPYKLFARTFEEFLLQNESVLVPLLLWHYNCEVTIIDKLCRALKKKGRQLFRYFRFSFAILVYVFDEKQAQLNGKKSPNRNWFGE